MKFPQNRGEEFLDLRISFYRDATVKGVPLQNNFAQTLSFLSLRKNVCLLDVRKKRDFPVPFYRSIFSPYFLVILRELISDNSLLIFIPSEQIFPRRELF